MQKKKKTSGHAHCVSLLVLPVNIGHVDLDFMYPYHTLAFLAPALPACLPAKKAFSRKSAFNNNK